ncbi:TonB-dependent receptor [Xylophilus sp.]|uniref:TonB-dependent receptor n=1 Tax=Xylophilus sp. TaxID=2653893 RepID=UPI0013B6A03F|nr:TonB-dependent receptor [Xylophilus sp.]KAF1046324.1 MAG: Pesticin receptor [Xylophilus sp.]
MQAIPFRFTVLALVAAAFTPALHAQDGAATASAGEAGAVDVLPQIQVTAERREASLQKTPVSVGVVSGEKVKRQELPLLGDLVGRVAGLSAGGGAASAYSFLFIRGIGTLSPAMPNAVALYLDDVYIPRIHGNGLLASYPDLQRVEVLRGPQDTLYGQNSSAGAIKFISQDPDPQGTNGWVRATAGNHGALGLKGYASSALNPGVLAASLAFATYSDDGYIDAPLLGRKVNRLRTDQFRAKFKLTPGDGLEAVLAIDGTRDRSDSPVATPSNYPGGSPTTTYENRDPSIRRDIAGASLRVSKKLDANTVLKSITAVRGFNDGTYPLLQDGLPTDAYGWLQNNDQKQASQEVQFIGTHNRFTYTIGAIYFREKWQVERPTWTGNASGTSTTYAAAHTWIDNTSYAIYGQTNYRITPELGVTVGARANRDRQDYRNAGYRSNAALEHVSTTYDTGELHQRTSGVTPKVGLDYQWTPVLLTYGTLSRGQKAGSYNPVAASLAVAQVPVNPEKVTTYELGTKFSAFGNRLQVNTSLFYNDFDDYQASISTPTINGVYIPGTVTLNAARAKTYGLEFEASARPTRQLTLNTALTLLQAKFVEFSSAALASTTDYTGNRLAYTPRVTFGLGATYAVPLSSGAALQLNANLRHTGAYFTEIDNSADSRVRAQTLVDAGASYITPDSHWTFALEVKNLFDKSYVVNNNVRPSQGVNSQRYNWPRTVQASVRYDFF